jgi:hypothetical protein
LIAFGSRSSGTPDAVGTQRLMMTTASYSSGRAVACTASRMSSKSLPVTSVSELKGT